MKRHKPVIKTVEVHRDHLLTMHESRENSLVLAIWSDACRHRLDEQNSRALDEMNTILFQKTPKKVLVNLRQCQIFLEPENLNRKDNFLFAMLEYENASLVAFVIPLNLFVYPAFEATRISLEQNRKNIKYFDDHNQALAWLLET
jgi:hypothetical protein